MDLVDVIHRRGSFFLCYALLFHKVTHSTYEFHCLFAPKNEEMQWTTTAARTTEHSCQSLATALGRWINKNMLSNMNDRPLMLWYGTIP